jgi:hypothetical protein
MKEKQVLDGIKTFIVNNINSYVEEPVDLEIETITDDYVAVEFPDTDSMRKSVMFYIVPDNEDFEYLTMSSDLASFNSTIFILIKKDTQENLITKAFTYFSALYQAIRNDPTLTSVVDETTIQTMEFYPAVEANKAIVGVEAKLLIKYAKEF